MGSQTQTGGQKQRRRRAYWLVVAVVLGLAGLSLVRFYVQSRPAVTGTIPVQISMAGFAPDEIRVRAGRTVEIELINLDHDGHADGGGWHDFVIDDLNVNERVAPKERITFRFTPTEKGVYDFYCDICCGGKENPFMHGRLIVE